MIGEDRLINTRILDKATKIVFLNQACYFYRQQSTSISHSYLDDKRIKGQINIESIVENTNMAKKCREYDKDRYILENIIYPHVWYCFIALNSFEERLKMYKIINSIIHQNKLNIKNTKTIRVHRRMSLYLLNKGLYKKLDILLKSIQLIKGINHE